MSIVLLFPFHLDEELEKEFTIAQTVGFHCEQLTNDYTRNSNTYDSCLYIYRGYMLTDEKYLNIYLACNEKLLVTPRSYNACHYYPNYYHFMKQHMVRSVCFEAPLTEQVKQIVHQWGCPFVSMKDYVKSVKHESVYNKIHVNDLDESLIQEFKTGANNLTRELFCENTWN